VAVNENLADFRVTYSNKDGLSFVKPRFEIIVLSKEGVNDPDKFELGIKMINQGAQMQIEGAISDIERILYTFMPPKKEFLKDIVISSDGEKTILKYDKDGVSSILIYAGDTRETKTKTPQGDFETSEQFTRLKGKLAPATNTTRIQQGQDTSIVTTTIHYQDLGKIFFPSVFEQHGQISSPNVKQEVELKITFAGCKVE
jgi:hypothetical protein